MKVRKHSEIWDRIKILKILLLVMFVLLFEAIFISNKIANKKTTMKSLFENALLPVGTTMYIWGGGWEDGDGAAGATSTQIGLYPKWQEFARIQDAEYDFTLHRYERENGLDCSGYVGWVVYNTFETKDGQDGYVTTSTDIAKNYAERGWGELLENPTSFLPGDIVSMDGHVWISLGMCKDGSVLLVHSSPPGVSVCGTQTEGQPSSIAIELAAEYMEETYPDWQKRYPNRAVPNTYLQNVNVFRWSEKLFTDVEIYQKMSAKDIYLCFMTE